MIQGIISHNNFIKIISFIIGYLFWSFIAQYQNITITESVPVCFYQTDENISISGPDYVNISLLGKRKDLYLFNAKDSAIHIDSTQYNKQGKNLIKLSRESLFLPDNIFLVELSPSSIIIEISTKDKSYETTS